MAQWDERDANDRPGYGNGHTNGSAHPGGEAASVVDEKRAQLEAAFENARVELDRYVSQAAEFVRERPVACLAGALALGFLVGKLASRR